jgi:hypothetical protein
MKSLLRRCVKRHPGSGPAGRSFRPQLEALEDRTVPTVTYSGGALLPRVEVQALYYGSDWWSRSYSGQKTYLDGFLSNVVNSSYMDMLSRAGYGVSRGSASPGAVYGIGLDKTQYLTDSQIRNALVGLIDAGALQQPDANRLYVIFAEDNAVVGNSSYNSASDPRDGFSYHRAFGSWTQSPSSGLWGFNNIRYAVIAYPRGGAGNGASPWLSDLDNLTVNASQELVDAVTDPDANSDVSFTAPGWGDGWGEVAYATGHSTVYLNGYAVQRVDDRNDQPMTPPGATAVRPVNFVLRKDGNLYVNSGSGLTWLQGGVASVSDQGIDDYGRAMVDVVSTSGEAREYHDSKNGDGGSWSYLTSGAEMAVAGQGVSYVLFNSGGQVQEYKDWLGTWTRIDIGDTSISAGTDRYGVNMEVEVWQGELFEVSDSTYFHFITTNVKAASAGQQGILAYLTTAGQAYWYAEANRSTSYLGSGVAQVTAGTDQYDNSMFDVRFTGGTLYEYSGVGGWNCLYNSVQSFGVQSIGKGRGGLVDIVFTWGDAYTRDSRGWWSYLTSNVKTAA